MTKNYHGSNEITTSGHTGRYINANFTFDQSVSAIHDSPPYFWDQWGWPPTETSLVTHARDHWWTLDFANAFVSPGVNSRAELVPSPRAYARNGAPRRWLGDKRYVDDTPVLIKSKFDSFYPNLV
jgi:hypothetical protein